MKRSTFFSVIFYAGLMLAFSCHNKETGELLTISVETSNNGSLPLSEISNEIKAIALEETDSSIISRVIKVIECGDYIALINGSRNMEILLFDFNGKFIRQIASRGQGPGEYSQANSIAYDNVSKQLFIMSETKIISYSLDGKLLKEKVVPHTKADLEYANGKLYLLSYYIDDDKNGVCLHSVLYSMNNDLQIIDSCKIRKEHFEKILAQINAVQDFITVEKNNILVYCADYAIFGPIEHPFNPILKDTLYQVDSNNSVYPLLRIKFKGDGKTADGEKRIFLNNIYKSSRYIFADYRDMVDDNSFLFCYDTKTKKGYEMIDGYIDDIHNLTDKVTIYPLDANAERFYYIYTDMDNLRGNEEPNPTLYIGTLKK
ncbi:MAG: 6-bladed beta-propeller [Dysgonamonadaceae bacterium]|jgi:hypothetical protein|nr:6-bladed beta-propeller [Dysgonamonadaceae bacterium]